MMLSLWAHELVVVRSWVQALNTDSFQTVPSGYEVWDEEGSRASNVSGPVLTLPLTFHATILITLETTSWTTPWTCNGRAGIKWISCLQISKSYCPWSFNWRPHGELLILIIIFFGFQALFWDCFSTSPDRFGNSWVFIHCNGKGGVNLLDLKKTLCPNLREGGS